MAKAVADPAKQVKNEKQSTLMGFFGKPKPGPPPPRPASVVAKPPATASPASTNLQTPTSAPASSPTIASASTRKLTQESPVRATSPLKKTLVLAEDDDLSPPPPLTNSDDTGMDVDRPALEEGSCFVSSRRAKRKVLYVESDSDAESDDIPLVSKASSRKPRKSLKAVSDEDDYVFDDQDDIAFAAAADEYESSAVSPASDFEPSPEKTKLKSKPRPLKSRSSFAAPKSTIPRSSSPFSPSSSTPIRPPPRPLGGGASGSRNNSTQEGSKPFLTEAEIRREDAARKKKENETCFDFIRPEVMKDKDGNRPDHPDYDPRTVYIPRKSFDSMSPFEKQFWEIKQNHFDTVLFFQKGKFFELYEEDARIGHREFDLKLTERVKMCMVGVPEQSFELWAAKFLGAGYKVGKVEQAETAIGKEMRTAGGQQDKIVRRELHQVFTNGTIVDDTYLTSDDANHCVAIKEYHDEQTGLTSFGICTLDASTGEFNLTAFEDDVVLTRLQTSFRQVRPKELLHVKGNLSADTQRLLRRILPSNALWQSFRDGTDFYSADQTIRELSNYFETVDDNGSNAKLLLPPSVESMLESTIAMEALGGMLFYLKTLNLDKDLVSQKNFNIYDPIKEGKSLVLDGVTLGHMEVLVNNEGGTEGTLLELLQNCVTPSGKRLFKIWLGAPLLEVSAINDRLDAVDDLLGAPVFTGAFRAAVKALPDLERQLSRLHAGRLKESVFLALVRGFETIEETLGKLSDMSESFVTASVTGLLRSAPDLRPLLQEVQSMYTVKRDEKSIAILPTEGADEAADEATAEVERINAELEGLLVKYRKQYKLPDLSFWHSAQGGKDIYQIQVPASSAKSVPSNWAKQGGTAKITRYYNSEVRELVRAYQEAKETESAAKKAFYHRLLAFFDKDRDQWLKAVRVIAEMDCLVSLSIASHNLDEPKCRPQFVEDDRAFVDFEELRHPSMCLRSDFIANDVKLGNEGPSATPRSVLLTGPNMAGKSTLLRMTAAGIIMAQMGCYVPAAKARLCPIDKIQTRMGAYDDMFSSSSTFKVELDECSKILREAGPRSFVILDELGRGTSTYDGMAIAGAVLHHLATHTLPLAFFATHYGSLTDDYRYHPNIANMHMQTHVDNDKRQVVFLYKLIAGVAESSHGTHVATMAGVSPEVVTRAEGISKDFFAAFKAKLAGKRKSDLPLEALADFVWLARTALLGPADQQDEPMALIDENGEVQKGKWKTASATDQMNMIRRANYGLA